MPSTVPKIHFDSAALPERERFDTWRVGVTAYDCTLLGDAAPGSFVAQVDAWLLGDLVITSNRLSPVRFVRSAAKASGDGIDHYSLILLRQGSWTGDVDGRMMTIGPGQLVAFDLSRPMVAEGTDADSITVAVVRNAVENVVPRLPDLHGLVLDGAMGRLLADHLLSLVRQLPAMQQEDVPAAVKATIALIAACLTSSETQEPAASAAELDIRHRVRRYIDQHLAAPDLTPDRICRDLTLSRSVLYRAVAPGPGIASYIRTRRLEAVHVLLADPNEHRGIADIAYGFGFVSDAHFSRSFRRRFGYSPREARLGAGRFRELTTALSNEEVPAAFREWMKKIG